MFIPIVGHIEIRAPITLAIKETKPRLTMRSGSHFTREARRAAHQVPPRNPTINMKRTANGQMNPGEFEQGWPHGSGQSPFRRASNEAAHPRRRGRMSITTTVSC